MKQKVKKSQFITEEYLDTRLEHTTETLLSELDKVENKLVTRMDKITSEMKADIKAEMTTKHNQVMTALDGIVKELETIREDRELAVYQTREIREQVEKHEKRLTKIEKLQHTT